MLAPRRACAAAARWASSSSGASRRARGGAGRLIGGREEADHLTLRGVLTAAGDTLGGRDGEGWKEGDGTPLRTDHWKFRLALEHALGNLTDALDALEYDPSAPDWDAQFARAKDMFAAALAQHADERKVLTDEQKLPFDYWFRPRMREMQNWFWIVMDKRSRYLNHLARNALPEAADPAAAPASPATLQDDVAALQALADRAEERMKKAEAYTDAELNSLTSADIYRLWRSRGRPCATDADGPGEAAPLNLPGYRKRW